jgi:hypothetical protein
MGGGQACVLYGTAEFSRDLDLALLPDPPISPIPVIPLPITCSGGVCLVQSSPDPGL